MQKNILITGATGNLGQAVVQHFLGLHYQVIAIIEPGTSLPAAPNLTSHPLDISQEAACQDFVRQFIHPLAQPLEAALLLVGGFAMGGLAETDGAALEKMYRLNFLTAYYMARPLFAHLLSQPTGGQLVFIGARPALEPQVGQHMVAYSLSKSLLFELAQLLNATGREKKVRASVIVPSTLDTPLNRQAMPNADPAHWVSPQYLAEIMAFLCSPAGGILRETVLKAYNEA